MVSPTVQGKKTRIVGGICLLLAVVTVLCYWPMVHHDFISLDDPYYVLDNPHVTSGLTWPGLLWAFSSGYSANWHPLTWVSHMMDCSLYGLDAGGHHSTNLVFHVADVLLLFLLFCRMTGAVWRSALVAALFAWHPLHVESVAWASERKDVLSTFFFLLTLAAYIRYTQESDKAAEQESGVRSQESESSIQPQVSSSQSLRTDQTGLSGSPVSIQPQVSSAQSSARSTLHAPRFYALALLFFALGLMSKPMLVTVPFVLLLLDYWPLQRLQLSSCSAPSTLHAPRCPLQRLFLEKAPFLVLAGASSVVTFLVQKVGGAVSSLETTPLHLRIANALLAYALYLSKTLWPVNLSCIYPYSWHLPLGGVLAAALLLLLLSGWFVVHARNHRFLLVGWLWYLGTLVPTIGLIQVGAQAMADRYMYIPSIGLFIIIAWGLDALLGAWPPKPRALAAAAALALAACFACTRTQLSYWQDSHTLFRHAIVATTDNYIAYDALGIALDRLGKNDAALVCYFEAARLRPDNAEAQYELGTALMKQGRLEEAIGHFTNALDSKPTFAHAHNNLGTAFYEQGKLDEAAAYFRKAAMLTPDDPQIYYNLGEVLTAQTKLDEAIAYFSQALRLKPDYWKAHGDLGVALMRQGKVREGSAHFVEALRLNPGEPELRFNLGLALLDQNQPAQAAIEFSDGLRLKPDDVRFHYRLAVALAAQGKSKQAIVQYREALRLVPDLPEVLNELAWILASDPDAQLRDGQEAVRLAECACEQTQYQAADMLITLATAYAETVRFPEAVDMAKWARDLALASEQHTLAAKAEELLKLYQSSQPYRRMSGLHPLAKPTRGTD